MSNIRADATEDKPTDKQAPWAKIPLPLLLDPPLDCSRYDMDMLGWLLYWTYEKWAESKHQRSMRAGKKASNKAHAARLMRQRHKGEYGDDYMDATEINERYEEWQDWGRVHGEPEPWHPKHNPNPPTEREAARKAYKRAWRKVGSIPQDVVLYHRSIYAVAKAMGRPDSYRSVKAILAHLVEVGVVQHFKIAEDGSIEVQLPNRLLAMTGRSWRKRQLPMLLTSDVAQRLDGLFAVWGKPRVEKDTGKKLPSLLSEGVPQDREELKERIGMRCDKGHSFRTVLREEIGKVNEYRAAAKGRGPQIQPPKFVGTKVVFKSGVVRRTVREEKALAS